MPETVAVFNEQQIEWTANSGWMYRATGSGNYYNVGRSKGNGTTATFQRPHTVAFVLLPLELMSFWPN